MSSLNIISTGRLRYHTLDGKLIWRAALELAHRMRSSTYAFNRDYLELERIWQRWTRKQRVASIMDQVRMLIAEEYAMNFEPCIEITAEPGEFADSFEQWGYDRRRAA